MSGIPNRLLRVGAAKLGDHKGHSRLYIQGKYLSNAGFNPAEKIKMIISDDHIELVLDSCGTTTISKKKKGESIIPVIDILSDTLKEKLGNSLEVRVSNQKIILRPDRISRLKNERLKAPRETSASIYAGGGLLSEASKISNVQYKEKFCIELNERYAQVYADNNPESRILNQEILEVNADDLEQVELLTIGQPCEAWSTARRSGKDYKKDSVPEAHSMTGGLIFDTMRVISIVNPMDVILECAPNFIGSASYEIYISFLKRSGYFVFSEKFDSKLYGSLQSRTRSVVVATTEKEYVPPVKSKCTKTIGEITENKNHDWFDETTESKKWLYDHHAKQLQKGNGFTKNLFLNSSDTHVKTIKKRYFAGQGDNPLLVNDDSSSEYFGSHRWFTLKEVSGLFELPISYSLASVPKTIAGEIMGQGVVVGLFKQIIDSIKNELLDPDELKLNVMSEEFKDLYCDKLYQPSLF